jgi:hypothetical protein
MDRENGAAIDPAGDGLTELAAETLRLYASDWAGFARFCAAFRPSRPAGVPGAGRPPS